MYVQIHQTLISLCLSPSPTLFFLLNSPVTPGNSQEFPSFPQYSSSIENSPVYLKGIQSSTYRKSCTVLNKTFKKQYCTNLLNKYKISK